MPTGYESQGAKASPGSVPFVSPTICQTYDSVGMANGNSGAINAVQGK